MGEEQARSNLLFLLLGTVLELLVATKSGDTQPLLKAGNCTKFGKLEPKCSCVFPFLLWHIILSAQGGCVLFKVIVII